MEIADHALAAIATRIFFLRGHRIIFDRDLAILYGVTTKALKQAVNRNTERFPQDFMFELNQDEFVEWRSQIVTSKSDTMGLRHAPYAFTEQGVAMLSSVLRSPRAIQVNILIMRSFVRLRQMAASHEDLRLKLDALEQRYDGQFKIVFDAIRNLIAADEEPKREIGFREDGI